MMFNTIKQAEAVAHTLSCPSKMPCYSYSIPAQKCLTGAKLRKLVNSICSICYAWDKGRYVFANVKDALMKRWESLQRPEWVDAMVYMINKKEKSGYFRHFDSGDLQGEWHLTKIVEIANRLPHIKFWLPTREYSIVSEWIKNNGSLPENLTVRLSAYMIDGQPPISIAKQLNLVTSGVSKDSYSCPAPKQDNKCGSCRACWNKSVYNVNYKIH